MAITVSQLLSHLAIAADIPVAEVASGELKTTQGANCWKYGSDYKYGGPVDCSGLITAIAQKYNSKYPRLTSASMQSMCSGPISTMPNIPGIFVWRSGHVGIFTGKNANGDKYTIEAFDSKYNVGRRGNRLTSDTAFTHWGYLDFVQY